MFFIKYQILIQMLISLGLASEIFKFSVPLDQESKVRLEWNVNDDNIAFNVTLIRKKLPFIFGLGFSDYGEFTNADLFFIEISNDKPKYVDAHTNSKGILIKDSQSDYYLESCSCTSHSCEILFRRKIDTCDKNDYLIDTGTTHIIHFILNEEYSKIKELFETEFYLKNCNGSHGMVRTQLLKSYAIPERLKKTILKNSKRFEIRNHDVKIPSSDTTYWCLVYKLNSEIFHQKHHIVGFEGIIDQRNEGVVHHMELFHCEVDPSNDYKNFSNVCTSEEKPYGLRKCRKVIAAWAMGASEFIYPNDVGGILGGTSYSMFLVLEIHYDNQNLRDDIIDSSGIRIYYTDVLRKYDAGIMEIGLEYNSKNSIPPRNEKFNLNGYCLSDCTSLGLSNEITVFASQLHTHLTGRKVWTTLIRRNMEKQILNSDYHYSPHFQEIRMLEKGVKIRPGDTLINTCEYNTESRKNMTLGGFGIRDEMCVNYMHYYPVVDLEVCKSSIRDDVLAKFFDEMSTLDLADTSSRQSIVKNFNKIRWTSLTSAILSKLYEVAPISFSCNKSNGGNILVNNGKNMNDYKAFKIPKNDFGESQRSCSSEFDD